MSENKLDTVSQTSRVYRCFSPRFIYNFIMNERKHSCEYYASLTEDERTFISQQRRRQWKFFFVSIAFHIFLITCLFSFQVFDSMEGEEAGELLVDIDDEVVEFELYEGMVSDKTDVVYSTDSNIIVSINDLKYKVKTDARLNDLKGLISNLKDFDLSGLSATKNVKKTSKAGQGLADLEKKWKLGIGSKSRKRRVSIQSVKLANLWDRLEMVDVASQRGKKGDLNYIMQIVNKKKLYLRDCYEKALLRDTNLSVNVVFFLKLAKKSVKSAKIQIKGNGNKSSRQTLSRCLLKETRGLHFAKNNRNMAVKFNLVFGL